MKRRDFLKSSMVLVAAATLGRPGKLFAQSSFPDIAVAHGERVKATVKAIDMIGGIGHFVKPGSKVVIKPNMSYNSAPEVAANTHPEVVAAVVELCKSAGAGSISVVDHVFTASSNDINGIREACNRVVPNCTHIIRGDRFFQEVSIPEGRVLKTTRIMTEVLEADVLIAVPKAKSHSSTGVSMTLKGNLGLITNRGFFHSYGIHECLADLLYVLKPTFTVIDASTVMTTNGPYGPGHNIEYNEIVASTDSVAADAYVAASYEWYGQKVNPENVGYLKEAAGRGLGRIDLENLIIQRENI